MLLKCYVGSHSVDWKFHWEIICSFSIGNSIQFFNRRHICSFFNRKSYTIFQWEILYTFSKAKTFVLFSIENSMLFFNRKCYTIFHLLPVARKCRKCLLENVKIHYPFSLLGNPLYTPYGSYLCCC